MRPSGLALLAFFYCDFRDDQKKDFRGLLSSLLVRLCDQSDAYCAILSDFYVAHGRGSQYASDIELQRCFKDMNEVPGQAPTYIIIDALGECPIAIGLPSPRDKVLELIKDIVGSQIPNLRICITSRHEADIGLVLDPLIFASVSLHGESGQAQDIAQYVKFIVETDPKMRVWRASDRELVIETLKRKADGM